MKATFLQLQFIENIEKNFRIKFLDYGFYSNGSIGINCQDQFGIFTFSINKDGIPN
jgi:hypothetical protein